jgi:hypothetical protein
MEEGEPYDLRIGPFTEAGAIERGLSGPRSSGRWKEAETEKSYPSDGRTRQDIYVPGGSAIEVKLLRLFGDNGREMKHWSGNALHPHEGAIPAEETQTRLEML